MLSGRVRQSSSCKIFGHQSIMISSLLFFLAAYATLAFAKTVTYNFDIGWVTVSRHYTTCTKSHLDGYRQHQMATHDKSLVLMASGRKIHHLCCYDYLHTNEDSVYLLLKQMSETLSL
jgi:hypothetical protein